MLTPHNSGILASVESDDERCDTVFDEADKNTSSVTPVERASVNNFQDSSSKKKMSTFTPQPVTECAGGIEEDYESSDAESSSCDSGEEEATKQGNSSSGDAAADVKIPEKRRSPYFHHSPTSQTSSAHSPLFDAFEFSPFTTRKMK